MFQNTCGHLCEQATCLCPSLRVHTILHSPPVLQIADVVLIGGRMAFTFLAAQGVAVGKTQIETDWLEVGLGQAPG